MSTILRLEQQPDPERARDLRDFAVRVRAWSAIFGQARGSERPHVASLMLDLSNRLKGTAIAYELLAAELEHPTVEEETA